MQVDGVYQSKIHLIVLPDSRDLVDFVEANVNHQNVFLIYHEAIDLMVQHRISMNVQLTEYAVP